MPHLSMPRLTPFTRPLSALCTALLLALLAAAPASAGSVNKILEECSEGRIPRGYSQQDYRQALRQMPSELAEYSDCPSLINKAQLANAAGPGGGAGGGPSGAGGAGAVAPPTTAEQRALESSGRSGGGPVSVGGETLHPGVVHVDIASALSSLPTPLIALLAFMLVGAVLIVGWTLRSRVRAGLLRRAERGERGG